MFDNIEKFVTDVYYVVSVTSQFTLFLVRIESFYCSVIPLSPLIKSEILTKQMRI